MLFSKNEIAILTVATEMYNEKPQNDFDPLTQRILFASVTKKLESISESTTFTPGELRFLYLSLHSECKEFLKVTGTIPFMDHAILLERLRTMQ